MAGSKKDAFETSILEHIFKNMAVSGVGDSGGLLPSSAPGSLYVALFTANPSDSAQGTEAAYTNYNRVAVARSAAGWTVTGGQAINAAVITFAQCGAVGATISGIAVCKSGVTGTNDQIYWGNIDTNLAVATGIIPEFAAGSVVIGED